MLKHPLITALGFMLGLHSLAEAATANIYRWVDANGQVHYADHPNHAKARPINLSVDMPLPAVAGSMPAPATASSATISKAAPPQVNINNADAATLAQTLEGVGEQKASAIVAHRKKHGPFKSVDGLDQVKGIGEKILEKNRARIVLK